MPSLLFSNDQPSKDISISSGCVCGHEGMHVTLATPTISESTSPLSTSSTSILAAPSWKVEVSLENVIALRYHRIPNQVEAKLPFHPRGTLRFSNISPAANDFLSARNWVITPGYWIDLAML